MNLTNIYSLILRDGLRQTKYRNSHLWPVPSAEEGKRGAIFAYRSKENMVKARGVVLTSMEAILENQDSFTHWTPNAYRFGAYSDANRRVTRGHSEDNLRQINTFYIDFDITSSAEEMTAGDILTTTIDLGFMPTLILKSDKGFQAYFVLEEPAYVTAHSQFRVVKVAKAISQNLRNYFNQTLPVDMTCNHFGIARIPRTDNVEFFHADYTYSFQEWLDWSMKQSDLPFPGKKPNLTVISGSEGVKQIDEPWYGLLTRESNIKGARDVMG
ncbi:replication protein RepR, partial [Streptococcus suis]